MRVIHLQLSREITRLHISETRLISCRSDLGGTTGGDHEFEYEGYEPLSRYYESSELTIFNRWGRVVYHSKDYKNDWDGDGLSDGTYFYVLKCHGLKNDATYQGSVMIIKTHR